MAHHVLRRGWFRVLFALYATGLLLWLTVGMLPVLVDTVPAISRMASSLAAGGGFLAEPATLLLHPTMTITGLSGNGLIEYAFSLLNLVLGVLLIVRRPDDVVTRLLALGLLGTAATFNLPSHEAFHLLGSPWPIAVVHFTFHIVSGVAYLWAVALFPDGRLPRRVAVSSRALAVAAVAVTAGTALVCWWSDFLAHPQFFVIFFGIAIPITGVGAQLLRITDDAATGQVRRSARLLVGALLPALTVGLIWCLAELLTVAGGRVAGVGVGETAERAAERLQDLFPAVFAIVPVVLFAGVLRYRLFDIDRILSRVLVYGLLILGSGAVYLAAVITGGVLFGGADWWTVVVLATAAVALHPAWSLAQRWANRVVFGADLGPDAAIKALITGLEQASATTEFDHIVDVSVRATRATRAELWLLNGSGWSLRAARWSRGTPPPSPGSSVSAPIRPSLVPGTHWPVEYQTRQLGVLTVQLEENETLPAAERALLADLAAHAGLLVHNTVLAAQLSEHVDALTERASQLSASRRRLVAAQDRERRRVERDLHDGAQQTLVAVMLGLRMAAAQSATADGAGTRSLLHQISRELQASTRELEELSGGRGPLALRERGLRGALEQAAATARRGGPAVSVTVDVPDSGLDADAVAAVYFCCIEALQNAMKYAHASSIGIEVLLVDEQLVFAVSDDGTGLPDPEPTDGIGGLTGLEDRVSLQRGWIAVDSSPGGGTRIRGAVPARDDHAGGDHPSASGDSGSTPGAAVAIGPSSRQAEPALPGAG